jgi:hypothetical protein
MQRQFPFIEGGRPLACDFNNKVMIKICQLSHAQWWKVLSTLAKRCVTLLYKNNRQFCILRTARFGDE